MYKKIFLVDNFDSFTFNLVDYFEQLGCKVHVYRNTVEVDRVSEIDPDLIVFSPGPSVPANAGNMMKIIERYHKKYPMFGVCLGHEAFVEYFGGSLKFVEPVHGRSSSMKHDGRSIFAGVEAGFLAGRYHSLCADLVPDCFEISAETEGLVMAMRHKELPIEGVQFHPESVLTMKGGNGFKMIKNVVKGKLGMNEIERFLLQSIEGTLQVEEQVAFLEAYTPDKVTAEDIETFAKFMQCKMTKSLNMPGAIDICGTGGSGLSRINTSTIASFILASLGVGIAKHGNNAASGRFGSFDLLEKLGVDTARDDLEEVYQSEGLAFIYARKYHPLMKHFAEARALIAKPTIFNLLGPLMSPAGVKRQIIGTAFEGQMHLIAEACRLLGKERVMLVCGADGLDEVTLSGESKVVELKDGEIKDYVLEPADFGLAPCSFKEISGGDAGMNEKIALDILEGKCESRHADLVYINCALALRLAGIEEDLKKGFLMAKEIHGVEKLKAYKGNILREIAETKALKKSDRDFFKALSGEDLAVIAEIKKASPSEGEIYAGEFDVRAIAREYESAGAKAISVLTDEKYFGGSFEYLRQVREAVSLPLLCKDFMLSEYQIMKARDFGADAILLIAGLLSVDQMKKLLRVAEDLGMDAICEVHDKPELEKVLESGGKIIGINNRNLKDFSVDLEITNELLKFVPEDKVVIAESGIKTAEDVKKLSSRVDALLVGTSLMRSSNIKQKLYEITQARTTQ